MSPARKSSTFIALLCCFYILFYCAGALSSGLYKWIDEKGNVHYGDTPPPDQATLEIKGQISSYTSPEVTALPDGFFDHLQKPARHQRVTMYTAEWCGVCKRAKKYFEKKKIPVSERDIDKSEQARKEFDKLGGRGVPIIIVGKKRLNGFSVAQFEKLYYN